jgi:hypothetical protein
LPWGAGAWHVVPRHGRQGSGTGSRECGPAGRECGLAAQLGRGGEADYGVDRNGREAESRAGPAEGRARGIAAPSARRPPSARRTARCPSPRSRAAVTAAMPIAARRRGSTSVTTCRCRRPAPNCGGRHLTETAQAPQYQTEIPRRPIYRQFDVHIGRCQDCGRRVQGRHALQTSDALLRGGQPIGARRPRGAGAAEQTVGPLARQVRPGLRGVVRPPDRALSERAVGAAKRPVGRAGPRATAAGRPRLALGRRGRNGLARGREQCLAARFRGPDGDLLRDRRPQRRSRRKGCWGATGRAR